MLARVSIPSPCPGVARAGATESHRTWSSSADNSVHRTREASSAISAGNASDSAHWCGDLV